MKKVILRKIIAFGVLSAVVSLLLACIGFGIVEFYKIRAESLGRLNAQINLLVYNLQSPLLFDDKEAAEKTIQSLRSDLSIKRIKLYRSNGQELASFIRDSQKSDITVTKRIIYNDKTLGWLTIDSVFLGIKNKVAAYLFICLVIIMISIPASYIISGPIRKQVSEAVSQLDTQSSRLRMLTAQVINTEQMERKRIAAIIHDHLQQFLVAGKLQLGIALKHMDKQQYEKAVFSLKRVDSFMDDATRAARTLTVELRPPVLYEAGLAAAFQWLANKFKADHNLDITLKLQEVPEQIPDTLKIMIFESVKELLFNVVKYAGINTAELALKYENKNILVTVKDQGRGFDLRQAEKISSDKGFGLFTIRERLKLLNGNLKISSAASRGTEIEMKVPVAALKETAPGPAQTSMGTELKGDKVEKKISILLVDDHKMVREGIANILKENHAFRVVAQAEDGEDALQKAEAFKPNVIIMDINMPKLNGIEATRAIKNKFPQINIIGLSVQDENNIADSMKKAGAMAVLNKAGDPHELIRTIMTCKLKEMVV